MSMWKTSRVFASHAAARASGLGTRVIQVDEKEEAQLMVNALIGISPKPNDIIGMIKTNFDL